VSASAATRPDLSRALELHRAGRLADAEKLYASYLAAHPDDAVALNNGGVAAMQSGDRALAISRFQRLVARSPEHAEGLNNLGYALTRSGRSEEALRHLERAVAIRPDYAQAHNNLGIAHEDLLHRDKAIRAFERAVTLAPAYADAAANLGDALNRDGETARARAVLEPALASRPAHGGLRAALVATEALEGRLDEALRTLEGMGASASHEPIFWATLGTLRNWAGDAAGSEGAFRRALALQPHDRRSRFGLASSLLARGLFEEGWTAFEARDEGCLGGEARFPGIARWDGRTIDGTLLLIGEQGLGDVVQFARFIPEARRRVHRLIVLLDGGRQSLAPLLATLSGVDEVLTDEAALAGLSEQPLAHASLLSLPYLLGLRLEDLPGAIPYLFAPEARRAVWRPRLDAVPRPRIGIAWAAYARRDMAYITRQKSIPLALLAPAISASTASFVSLQLGPSETVGRHEALAPRIADFTTDIGDFGDTAAIIAELDLVISTDTSVAHVAAALGKPVWMLDRYNTCWRWRLAPDSSPWYPTIHIFRQKSFGDWSEPLSRLAEALRALEAPRAADDR